MIGVSVTKPQNKQWVRSDPSQSLQQFLFRGPYLESIMPVDHYFYLYSTHVFIFLLV